MSHTLALFRVLSLTQRVYATHSGVYSVSHCILPVCVAYTLYRTTHNTCVLSLRFVRDSNSPLLCMPLRNVCVCVCVRVCGIHTVSHYTMSARAAYTLYLAPHDVYMCDSYSLLRSKCHYVRRIQSGEDP